MNIYIQSAGTVTDYHWLTTPSNPDLLKWHDLLCEQDKAFALVAGYSEGAWHIELRNLLLPDVTDEIASRQIVFNICFCGLVSEAEVRALALAYLDSELKLKRSGRPIARYIPELAAAFSLSESGDFNYDTDVAAEWAKKAIIAGKKEQEAVPGSESLLRCSINPNNLDEKARLREYLEKTVLSKKEGLRLVWSDMPQPKQVSADIILKYTDESSGSWETLTTPVEKPFAEDSPVANSPVSFKDTIAEVIKQAKIWIPTPTTPSPGSPKPSREAVLVIVAIGIFTLILGTLFASLCLPGKKKDEPKLPDQPKIVAPSSNTASSSEELKTAPKTPTSKQDGQSELAPATTGVPIPAVSSSSTEEQKAAPNKPTTNQDGRSELPPATQQNPENLSPSAPELQASADM